ncbi:hypothetical protein LINGRAHAP2_LOCUS30379 [Linum grandiflorum]
MRREQVNNRDRQWKKPSIGVLKLNTDAGFNQRGETGIGCVFQDWNGEFVFVVASTEATRWPIRVAEGRAILFGLRIAIEQGLTPLIVESDCKSLVDLLSNNIVRRTELGIICADIFEQKEFCDVREWSFTSRDANNVAHQLAHLFPPVSSNQTWDGVPSFISGIVAAEASVS